MQGLRWLHLQGGKGPESQKWEGISEVTGEGGVAAQIPNLSELHKQPGWEFCNDVKHLHGCVFKSHTGLQNHWGPVPLETPRSPPRSCHFPSSRGMQPAPCKSNISLNLGAAPALVSPRVNYGFGGAAGCAVGERSSMLKGM